MSAFSAALVSLLEPQERFEKLRAETVFRVGRGLCDLAYANPYDGALPEVRRILQHALSSERGLDLQYTPYGGGTIARRAIADSLSASHGEPFRWRDVVMTPGAMSALCVAFRCAGDGEILVITPCWMDYFLYLENLGIPWRAVPLTADHRLDIAGIRAALRPSTRAVVLSQPANPTGHVYGADELRALAAVLREQDSPPLWISDECHREVLFEGTRFTSPASVYDRTCIVYSFGKSLFMQGQRIGYLATSPRMADRGAFSAQAVQAVRAMGYCAPTALMQLALPELLELTPDFSWIERRSRRLARGLIGAGYEVARADGTFFLYVKSPDPDDFAFATSLARHGVLVMPSSLFHQAGFFRASVTASDAMIDAALPAFERLHQVAA